MFVIQVQNALGETSKHYWMNQSGDDFLRYLPRNFGVPKENIRAWMFSDDDFPILEGLLKALGDVLEGGLELLGVLVLGNGGDESGEGAGLRISGGSRKGQNALTGNSPWKKLGFEFEANGADVVLVAEVRATKGEAWFQVESLQIVKLK